VFVDNTFLYSFFFTFNKKKKKKKKSILTNNSKYTQKNLNLVSLLGSITIKKQIKKKKNSLKRIVELKLILPYMS
jgi:hypothetical protein